MATPYRGRAPGSAMRIVALGALLVTATCYGPNSRQSCSHNSDCTNGVCSGEGFCWSECAKDQDCPCGAYCAVSCGACLRVDNGAPATCFLHNRGLTGQDAIGVCRGWPRPAVVMSMSDAADCSPPELTCETFHPQPSEDAVRDAAVDLGPAPVGSTDGPAAEAGDGGADAESERS